MVHVEIKPVYFLCQRNKGRCGTSAVCRLCLSAAGSPDVGHEGNMLLWLLRDNRYGLGMYFLYVSLIVCRKPHSSKTTLILS